MLQLLPDSFVWQGEEFPYEEVIHLGRRAKRTSVNLLPVADSLDISIQVPYRAEPFEISALGLAWGTRKLESAYKTLAEATFRDRLSAYLEQVHEKGYFEYGGAQFHRSGKVERAGRSVDLETGKTRWGPFELHIKPKGVFSQEIVVSTFVDQDALFFLMKKLYRIAFR